MPELNRSSISLAKLCLRGYCGRLLTVELHWKDNEKTGLPGLPIKGPVKIAK
jgi:hypothetical protein